MDTFTGAITKQPQKKLAENYTQVIREGSPTAEAVVVEFPQCLEALDELEKNLFISQAINAYLRKI